MSHHCAKLSHCNKGLKLENKFRTIFKILPIETLTIRFQAIEKNALLENEMEDKAGLQEMVQRLKDESRGEYTIN